MSYRTGFPLFPDKSGAKTEHFCEFMIATKNNKFQWIINAWFILVKIC